MPAMQTIARDALLRAIALAFSAAFASLYVQAPGLFGVDGLLPIAPIVADPNAAWTLKSIVPLGPTLFGLHPDLMLEAVSLLGFSIAVLVAFWRPSRNKLAFAALFVLYHSLYAVGQTFLGFQWDILLLEVGVLAVVAAPFYWRLDDDPHVAILMMRWLLFRLMYQSGVVKLQSGCPTWWNLTAMDFHYNSQCISTPLAYYAHQLPHWLQALSVVAVYVIEIVLPFFFFAPIRPLRLLAGWAQILLMVLIAATGNYNFFNFLTGALALSCFDDAHLAWLLSSTKIHNAAVRSAAQSRWWPWYASHLVTMTCVGIIGAQTVQWFDLQLDFSTHPESIFGLRLLSKVAFTRGQFDDFNRTAVSAGMALGGLSFLLTAGRSMWRAFTTRPRRRGVWRLFSAMVTIAMSAFLFSGSLVAFLVVDRDHPIKNHAAFASANLAYDLVDPWSAINSYGLFRRMTGVEGRPEVVVEGSMDSVTWQEFHFFHKPGNVSAAPTFCVPHQPRLDWQMWFAALGSINRNPWLVNLVYHLLKGTPSVAELMPQHGQPFTPDAPPRFIRLLLYKYHFARVAEQPWWHRTLPDQHTYLRPLQLGPELDEYRAEMGWTNLAPPPTVPANWLDAALRTVRSWERAMATVPPFGGHLTKWASAGTYVALLACVVAAF